MYPDAGGQRANHNTHEPVLTGGKHDTSRIYVDFHT